MIFLGGLKAILFSGLKKDRLSGTLHCFVISKQLAGYEKYQLQIEKTKRVGLSFGRN